MTVIGEKLWIEMPGEVARPHRCVIISARPAMQDFEGKRRLCHRIRVIGMNQVVDAPTADVVPAAALSRAELAEYDRLDGELAGTIGDRKKLKPFMALFWRRQLFGLEELAA